MMCFRKKLAFSFSFNEQMSGIGLQNILLIYILFNPRSINQPTHTRKTKPLLNICCYWRHSLLVCHYYYYSTSNALGIFSRQTLTCDVSKKTVGDPIGNNAIRFQASNYQINEHSCIHSSVGSTNITPFATTHSNTTKENGEI